MNFQLPRRHRRQLLFPPGLLALAGLLWLGCAVINSWQEKLKQKSVVEIFLPPLRTGKDSPAYNDSPAGLSPRALDRFRCWRDIYFNGQSKNDSVNLRNLNQAAGYMQAHATHEHGIRVRFSSRATYTSLVTTLNTMLKHNIRRYWLDIKHRPTAFYAFTGAPVAKAKPEFVPFCGTMYANVPTNYSPDTTGYWSASYLIRIEHWLATLWNPELIDSSRYTSAVGTGTEYDTTLKLEQRYSSQFLGNFPLKLTQLPASFRQSDWGIQFLLIIGMAAISWRKIKRQW